jgi:hypothetical protein
MRAALERELRRALDALHVDLVTAALEQRRCAAVTIAPDAA